MQITQSHRPPPTPAPVGFDQDCGACGQPLTANHVCPSGSVAR